MATLRWFWATFYLVSVTFVHAKDCFENCGCLGEIIDCSDKGLEKLPSNLPTWVEGLDFSKNPGIIIQNDSFLHLRNLKTLSLQSLKLRDAPHLPNLHQLKKLSLSKNRIQKISPGWLQNMASLQEIDLSKNDFETFDPSQFEHKNLRKIDLKSNRIDSVIASSFSLPNVNDLRLYRNRIGDEAFKNLSTSFTHMPSLKALDLNRNTLKRWKGLMFQHLINSSLATLKLRRNNLVDFTDGVFYGLKSLVTLHLDNNKNITKVSNGWLFGLDSLRFLTLSHNNIGIIEETAWDPTKMLSLLDISYNKLGCLHREPVFKGLNNLKKLFATHNCLANLDSDTFASLTKLKILDISHNHLHWSIEHHTGVFRSLTDLVSLNLAYNKIETLPSNVFHSLTALTTLNLSGNNLKTLSQNPFIRMKSLAKLDLNTSSLVCDCHLVWLPKWLSTRSFNAVKAFCAYPEEMKDVSIYNLDPSRLKCQVSPQPVIKTSPSNQTVLYGQNMTLECVAESGGDEVHFIWMKDKEMQEPFRIKTFRSVEATGNNETTVYKVVSHLNYSNITHDHNGIYQCIARNSYGPSYSPLAQVKVHRFPYFTKIPQSVKVREGDVAKLACNASGDPPPEISLRKEGDKFFHAAREHRILLSDHVYFIKPVKPQDEGTYVCTARNEAGSVSTSANVSVIQTPNFSRAIQYNQEAAKGQSIALECQGTGNPKPKVTWHKGGKRVVQDANRVLLENGQFLLLLSVDADDDGAYLCELTNTVGTKRRKIVLTVAQEYLLPTTGIVVITVAISMVVTSIIWVLIIYGTWKRRSSSVCTDPTSGGGLNHIHSSHLSMNNIHSNHKGQEIHGHTPLLSTSHVIEGYTTHLGGGQDSGSEHSSGKDSGVGEPPHRSTEDLHRNGDIRTNGRRSLIYSDTSPNAPRLKGQNNVANIDTSSEEIRPKLSTFGGTQHLDPSRTNGNSPIYASLRRGSTSRLLPVPSPVTPANSLAGSLPRYGYRSHSNSGSIGKTRGHYGSGSSHTLPRSGTPPPPSLEREDEDSKDFWKAAGVRASSPTSENHSLSLNETAEQIYNYYSDPHCSFSSLSRTPKRRSLKQAKQDPHLFPSR